MTRLLLVMLLLLSSSTTGEVIWTYTNTETGPDKQPLGYPVPIPIDSLLPVDGFRTYASLHARHQDLMLLSDNIRGQVVGNTIYGRDIWAYVLSDPDDTNDEGFLKEAAVLQNGTIHSREWASPEVTTGLMERLADNEGDQGFYDYLLNNLNIIILPVQNVDGFLQTQRYPDQAMQTTYVNDPDSWPRDGRMRRKNMLDVDEILETETDTLLGVDLNRNSDPFWASTSRSSNDVESLVHHGIGPGSEPESQALYAAADLGPADRLRFYVDTHSYSQLWFQTNTNNQRRNTITDRAAARMRAATNNTYDVSPNQPGTGIGSTDDYFAFNFEIPAFTLEIEPGGDAGAQYGGFETSHSGFVLPESEIARVRNELADASMIAWYMMAGPASVSAIEIRRTDTDAIVFSGQWQTTSATEREWQENINAGLASGLTYQIWVAYNKPMRWLDEGDNITQFSIGGGPLGPRVLIEGRNNNGAGFRQQLFGEAEDWLVTPGGPGEGYLRYKADAFILSFQLDTNIDPATASLLALAFDNRDIAVELNDADPGTVVDYNRHWIYYESSDGSRLDSGGIDRTVRLINDGSDPFVDPNRSVVSPPPPVDDTASGGGGGTTTPVVIIIMLLLCCLRRLGYYN